MRTKKDADYDYREGWLAFQNDIPVSNIPFHLHLDPKRLQAWQSGWMKAKESRERGKAHHEKLFSSIDWGVTYDIGFLIMGGLLFIVIWIYALASWGFLLGLMFGWIPAIHNRRGRLGLPVALGRTRSPCNNRCGHEQMTERRLFNWVRGALWYNGPCRS